MSDVPIADLLAGLGLAGADAAAARGALEAAGLTNPRKTRISTGKVEAARAAVDAAFARLCRACAAAGDPSGRRVLEVPAAACTRCSGSRASRALAELVAACSGAGIARLVVVGGSPDIRRELAAALSPPLELRLVDGTARRTRSEAQGDLAWADLVLVCGATELAHKVSTLYTRGGGPAPVVTSPRRGVEAIAGEVVEYVRRLRSRRA